MFMPVGTNATVKALDPDDLRRGRRADHPRQHLPPLPAAGPRAHRAARWPAPVHGLGPADPDRLGRLPGGQPRRPASRSTRTASPSGRHLDGSTHRFTPEHSIAVQEALGSDIAVCLRPARAAARLDRAPRWPKRPRARTAGRSAASRAHERPDQALFGIIQGGLEPDLRAESTRAIAGAALRRPLHRRPGRRRDAGAAPRGPRRRRAAAGRRSAAALPDGPRLAARPARCGRRRRRHVRLGAAGAGRPQRHAVGARGPAEPAQRALPGRPATGPGGLSLPRSAGRSRAPTWRTCSGPTSCSPTGSRLVTT